MSELVSADFAVPVPPPHPLFRFAVLGPEHNESDLAAWASSIDHIRATPGWEASTWPRRPCSAADNLADLAEHRDHHLRHLDFAWTVLDPSGHDVIGCVYLKPDATGGADAEARSWVRSDRASLDGPLRGHLARWWSEAWPLRIRYAG